jgi:hypothetical protein
MKQYHRIALLSILASCVDAQVSPCTICPNGVTAAEGEDHIPWADIGDTRTCAELIDAAMLVQAGTVACGWYELDKVHCCYAEPVNPCDVCLNGDTEANDDFQPFSQLGDPSTCDSLYDNGSFVETESDLCDVLGTYCCPSKALTTVTPVVTPQVNPCIVCPNGVTAPEGENWAPLAGTGDQTTCAEFIEDYKQYESGTAACELGDFNVGIYCCWTAPLNPCSICPNGVTAAEGDDYAPYVNIGNPITCGVLVVAAPAFELGSYMCGHFEAHELVCCPALPENACSICPNGATVGGDYVPEALGSQSCNEWIDLTTQFESSSSFCGAQGEMVASDCCPMDNPPPTPVISSPTPVPVDDTSVVNPCIVCPNGVTAADDTPFSENGDFTTCAELLEDYKQYESGTGQCEFGDFIVGVFCCYSEPKNPCNICPNGITAAQGNDYVPYEESGDTRTCAQFVEYAQLFESGS